MCLCFHLQACPECGGTCGKSQASFIPIWFTATECIRNANYEVALDLMDKAIEACKLDDNSFLYLTRADVFAYLGNYDEAISDVKHVIQVKRDAEKKDYYYTQSLIKLFAFEFKRSGTYEWEETKELSQLRLNPWVKIGRDGDYVVYKTIEGFDKPSICAELIQEFVNSGLIACKEDVAFMNNGTVVVKMVPIDKFKSKNNKKTTDFKNDFFFNLAKASIELNMAIDRDGKKHDYREVDGIWYKDGEGQCPANEGVNSEGSPYGPLFEEAAKNSNDSPKRCHYYCNLIGCGMATAIEKVPTFFGRLVTAGIIFNATDKCNECCEKGWLNCWEELYPYIPTMDYSLLPEYEDFSWFDNYIPIPD